MDQRIKELRKLVWINSISGQTDEARHHVQSQQFVQKHECIYQSKLFMPKTTPAISSRFKKFKIYLTNKIYTKEAS